MFEIGAVPPVQINAASCGRGFDGWTSTASVSQEAVRAGTDPPDVARAHPWLLTTGWRRWGLVDPAEGPGFAWIPALDLISQALTATSAGWTPFAAGRW